MSNLLQPKQIQKLLASWMGVAGFTLDADSSGADVVTADITGAAATAGNGNTAVPVQVATTGNGFLTAAPDNKVVIKGVDGGGIESPDGTEVYGRLTEAAGVYTVTYFYMNAAGTETAYTAFAGETAELFVPYQFTFADLPNSALIKLGFADANSTSTAQLNAQALLTPTATDTIPNLPTAAAGAVNYYVNGKMEDEQAGGAVSRTGQAVTWSAVNAGYNVETTDRVIAHYAIA